jgi:hypothetical protein
MTTPLHGEVPTRRRITIFIYQLDTNDRALEVLEDDGLTPEPLAAELNEADDDRMWGYDRMLPVPLRGR